MTLEEFLARLAKTPRKWQLYRDRIRVQDPDGLGECPITSLVGVDACEWAYAADELGLAHKLALEIVRAADCPAAEYQPVRKLLLEACGLHEDMPLDTVTPVAL